MPKGSLIDFGPTAGLYYSNGKFYDEAGNRVDPSKRPAPAAPAQAAPAAVAPPVPAKPFALPSFDASQFGTPPAAEAPPPVQATPQPAPLPSFMQPPEPVQSPLPSFMPPPAESPLPSFENMVAPPPMTQASVSAVGPTPERVPFAQAPAGGLLQAQNYSAAPDMPGYAQARTGSPFRAPPQAADLGNLFGQMSKPQPFGAPVRADEDDMNSLLRAAYGRNSF